MHALCNSVVVWVCRYITKVLMSIQWPEKDTTFMANTFNIRGQPKLMSVINQCVGDQRTCIAQNPSCFHALYYRTAPNFRGKKLS